MKLCFALVLGLLSQSVFAAESKPTGTTENPLRCEKFSDGGMSELKEKLGTHCQLEKPYTMSVSRDQLTGNEIYYYCCIKK